MHHNNQVVKIDIDESLKERINLYLNSMDKHTLNIIRAAAKIDFILRESVKFKLVNKIDLEKIIGDSLAKLISLSFALGVIKQKTYESLLNFNKMRNRMAHEVEPDLKLSDMLSMLLFLGKNAEKIVEERGAHLVEWHNVSLELLLEHIQNEVNSQK